jgi:hypothetical protein
MQVYIQKRFLKIWFLCHSFLYLLFLTIIHTVLHNNTYIHPSSFARGMSSCILIASGSGCFYLASRDFFQEKQSYLLTESPLAKHEGGEGTTPFTPLPYRVERDFHTILFLKLLFGTDLDQNRTLEEIPRSGADSLLLIKPPYAARR